MLALVKVAANLAPFGSWVPVSEAIGRSKSERLDLYLNVLYELLRDLLILREARRRNPQPGYPRRAPGARRQAAVSLDPQGRRAGG